jgi:putative methyltransferase (TIGR04325 family)
MPLAPIVLFVYNRFSNTENLLNSLSDNKLAHDSILYIFADGPKQGASKEELKEIEAVRTLLTSKKWCKENHIITSASNLGCAPSIINGVTEVVNKYGRVIVLEDDLNLSPYFLDFMNDALNLYESNLKVSSIGGCNFFACGKRFPSTFFIEYPDCWGWATWSDRWKHFEYDANKLLHQLEEKKMIKKFNGYGAFDMVGLLKAQINNHVSAWDVQWTATCVLNGWLTLYPNLSISQHIYSGSATHAISSVAPPLLREKLVLEGISVEVLPEIRNAMKLAYQGKGDFYGNKISVKKNKAYFKIRLKQLTNFSKRIIKYIIRENALNRIIRFAKNLFKKEFNWFTIYPNWDRAKEDSVGYDAQNILEKCTSALIKVRDGDAAYERDSIIFQKIEYNFGLVTGLLKAALENDGHLCVLDFGGSLGTTYFQHKNLFRELKSLKWCIVEQAHFVKSGKDNFENDELKFYLNIDECLKENKPNVLLLGGVIQYLSHPQEFIESVLIYKFPYIILDRTSFVAQCDDLVCLQNVPEFIYKASYPCHFFNKEKFLSLFEKKYTNIAAFSLDFSPPMVVEKKTLYWEGFIFKK